MARNRYSQILNPGLLHLPTAMLLIGYVAYWLELYLFKLPRGRTTPLATILFLGLAGGILFSRTAKIRKEWEDFRDWLKGEGRVLQLIVTAGMVMLVGTLLVACIAALLPPHLLQESDVLMYHVTLPRQHLIERSFRHLPWATADLYYLPVDLALAPYCLATPLPNKFPQFLFQAAFLAMSVALVAYFTKRNYLSMVMVLFALGGSHIVGIQLGTAMLDLVVVYLFLAALHSVLAGSLWWAAVELTFYVWAKSFIPVQVLVVSLAFAGICRFLLRRGFTMSWVDEETITTAQWTDLKNRLKKIIHLFLILSLFVAGPFMVKSLYYSGTPLFPFGAGLWKIRMISDAEQSHWQAVVKKAQDIIAFRSSYGSGMSFADWIAHFWLIAVPERGVVNRYDYPVGLPYLLMVMPFFYQWGLSLRRREFTILSWAVIVYWAVWWIGSQQTRFMMLPLMLLFISVSSFRTWPRKTLLAALVLAMLLVTISVVRAHRQDWGRWGREVLREKDKRLLEMARDQGFSQRITLDFPDAAYAEFPVLVDLKGERSVFVIEDQ